MHRLLLHGALEHEVERERKNYASNLQVRHAQRHDVEATELAGKLTTHFLNDEETGARLAEEHISRLSLALLDTITAADVSAYGASA